MDTGNYTMHGSLPIRFKLVYKIGAPLVPSPQGGSVLAVGAIFTAFEGQKCNPAHPALHLHGSVEPSLDFQKELQPALPWKVCCTVMEGDPQTWLQDDKDPMLIVPRPHPEGSNPARELDPDPDGYLGF